MANCSGILSDFWGGFCLVDGLRVLGRIVVGGVNVWSVSGRGGWLVMRRPGELKTLCFSVYFFALLVCQKIV